MMGSENSQMYSIRNLTKSLLLSLFPFRAPPELFFHFCSFLFKTHLLHCCSTPPRSSPPAPLLSYSTSPGSSPPAPAPLHFSATPFLPAPLYLLQPHSASQLLHFSPASLHLLQSHCTSAQLPFKVPAPMPDTLPGGWLGVWSQE